jgi:alpha-ketoglutarate-dependent taurine dioxygenase
VAAVFFTSELEQALTEVRQRDEGARVHEHGPEVIDFREVLPAVHTHPVSGEKVWFNGVHTNHRSYYVEAAHVDTSDGSPMDTSYADGTPITDETIAQVRAAYWRNSVAVRMQTGDVTFLDNMLVSHGRMSWVPPAPRRMLLTHFVKRVDGDEQEA